MGQACQGNIVSCVDCNTVNTQELLSEPSKKLDISSYNQLFTTEFKDPIVKCIEKIDLPLTMYEKELNGYEKLEKKSNKLDDSLKLSQSPRLKIISSNFNDRSINLIDKIDRTAETDKSSSSLFYSSLPK
jgi:hypothetical protein